MSRVVVLRLVLVVAVAATVVEVALAWHFGAAHPDATGYPYLIEGLVTAPVFLGLTWLLVARRPELSLTLVFAAALFFGAVQGLTGTYGHEAMLGHRLPGGVPALAASGVAQGFGVICSLVLLNLFPTGRPATRRWRVVLYVCAVSAVATLIAVLAGDSPFGDAQHLAALAGIPGPLHAHAPAVLGQGVEAANGVLALATVGGTLAHLVVRFRRARGLERQQLRVFVYSVLAGVAVILLPWHLLVEAVVPLEVPDWFSWSVGPALVWGGMGAAVLRHRLYDIDRIVSRTVAWTVVSVALIVTYLGIVVGLQTLLVPAIGDGDLPVALATLTVAAVARPALRRVRAFVDRRFDRAHYDAVVTVDAFGRVLRDEVSQDAVIRSVRAITVEALAPAHVSLVLTGGGGRSPGDDR